MESSTSAATNLPAGDPIREAVSRYAAAWLAGDRAAVVASYHEDFTLHYFGGHPLAGVHRGKQASLAVLAEVTRRTNRKLLERLPVYSVRDGLLWHCWVYDQDQALVDAFLA